MSSVNIDLAADAILNVMVGQQDENEVREVVFDFSDWYTTYGSGTISLAIQRPKDEWPYEGTLTVDNSTHKATWEISDTDSAYAGVGQIQLSYTVGTAVKKSVVYRFTVHKSLGAMGNVITPIQIQTFIDEVTEALEDMQEELNDVKADLTNHEKIINRGNHEIVNTDTLGTAVDLSTFPSRADLVNARFSDVKNTHEGYLDTINIRVDEEGTYTIVIALVWASKYYYQGKFEVSCKHGINTLVNGVDFSYNEPIFPNSMIGVYDATKHIYFKTGAGETSYAVSNYTGKSVSLASLNYAVSINATIKYSQTGYISNRNSIESLLSYLGNNFVEKTIGSADNLVTYPSTASGNQPRYSATPYTGRYGYLKKVSVAVSGSGTEKILLGTVINGVFAYYGEFTLSIKDGYHDYINGIDFTFDNPILPNTIIGLTQNTAMLMFYTGSSDKSYVINESTPNNVPNVMNYSVAVKGTVIEFNKQDNVLDEAKKLVPSSRYLVKHDFIADGLTGLTGSSWSASSSGVSNSSEGWGVQLYKNIRTDLDSHGMRVRFVAGSGCIIAIGNRSTHSIPGTFFLADFTSGKLKIIPNWEYNTSSIPSATAEKTSTVALTTGREYIIEYKRETLIKARVTIYDCLSGQSDSLEKLNYGLYDSSNPCVIAVAGNMTLKYMEYFSSMPVNSPLAIFGDSFVEAGTLGQELNKRYASLIQEALGEPIFIDGLGGETSYGLLLKYENDSLTNAKYTLIATGMNDASGGFTDWKQNYFGVISLVERKGSIPILATVSRNGATDNLSFITSVNDFIRNSGYPYLDVARALSVNNDGVTQDTNLVLSDLIHPNVAGHKAIYDRTWVDIPFIYDGLVF